MRRTAPDGGQAGPRCQVGRKVEYKSVIARAWTSSAEPIKEVGHITIKENTIIHDDSLTVLRQMEAESIDAIITDPPYGINYVSQTGPGLRTTSRPSSGSCMTPTGF